MQEHPTSDFSAYLESQGKQAATVESYSRDARQFHAYLTHQSIGLQGVTPDTLVQYEDYLRNSRASRANSVRRQLIGVRMYFRFLTDVKKITESPAETVAIPKRNDNLPKAFPPKKFDEMLRISQEHTSRLKGSRDAAILALLGYEGIKANELIALEWRHLLPSGSGYNLWVPGKRERQIQLQQKTSELLDSYRDNWELVAARELAKSKQSRMFVAFQGRDGAVVIDHITRHGLKFMLYELGEKAALKHINTELLRHHSVTYLLGLGLSIDAVMHHLGLKRGGNVTKHSLSQRAGNTSFTK